MKNKKYNRIYAYWTDDSKEIEWTGGRSGKGLIKVGQTSALSADIRIKNQLQGAINALANGKYEKLLDIEALDNEGNYFTDCKVHRVLVQLGCYRIPKTEWFECTEQEVEEAINICINNPSIYTRAAAYSTKDTAENRGYAVDNKLTVRERNLLDFQAIVDTMRRHPEEAVSNVQIAKYLVKDLGLTQYASSTVSIIIGPLIKELINGGYIVNEGTSYAPKLKLVKVNSTPEYKNKKCKKVSLEYLLTLIGKSKYGATLNELVETTGCYKSYIHSKLMKKVVAIRVRKKHQTSNVFEVRCFLPNQEVMLPDNEIEYVDKEATNKYAKYFCKVYKGLFHLTYRRSLADVSKRAKVSESILREIFEYCPKFTSKFLLKEKDGTTYVYRRSSLEAYKPKNVDKVELIISKLKEYKEGITVEELTNKTGVTQYSIRKILNNLLETNQCVKIAKKHGFTTGVPKGFSKYIHISNYEPKSLTRIVSLCSRSTKSLILNIGMSEQDILDIVKEVPYISSGKLCEELHKRYPNYLESAFNSPVAEITKILDEEQIIVNLGSRSARRWHLVDKSHPYEKVQKFNISQALDFVKSNKCGATVKEIWMNDKNAPLGTIGIYVVNSPLFNCVKVYKEGKHPYYRCFASDQMVVIPDGEYSADLFG